MAIKDSEFSSIQYSDRGEIYGLVRSAPELSDTNMELTLEGSPVIFQPNQFVAYFNPKKPVLDQQTTSRILPDPLVRAIQAQGSDGYFNDSTQIHMVVTEYTHTGDRQKKRTIHRGPNLVGDMSWAQGAKDGTWELTQVVTYDVNGAKNFMTRPNIDTDNDVVLSDGTAILN